MKRKTRLGKGKENKGKTKIKKIKKRAFVYIGNENKEGGD